jgi:hypothetical protein
LHFVEVFFFFAFCCRLQIRVVAVTATIDHGSCDSSLSWGVSSQLHDGFAVCSFACCWSSSRVSCSWGQR